MPPPGLPPHVPPVVGPSRSVLPAPLLQALRAASVQLAARLPLSEAGLSALPGPPLTRPACLRDGVLCSLTAQSSCLPPREESGPRPGRLWAGPAGPALSASLAPQRPHWSPHLSLARSPASFVFWLPSPLLAACQAWAAASLATPPVRGINLAPGVFHWGLVVICPGVYVSGDRVSCSHPSRRDCPSLGRRVMSPRVPGSLAGRGLCWQRCVRGRHARPQAPALAVDFHGLW